MENNDIIEKACFVLFLTLLLFIFGCGRVTKEESKDNVIEQSIKTFTCVTPNASWTYRITDYSGEVPYKKFRFVITNSNYTGYTEYRQYSPFSYICNYQYLDQADAVVTQDVVYLDYFKRGDGSYTLGFSDNGNLKPYAALTLKPESHNYRLIFPLLANIQTVISFISVYFKDNSNYYWNYYDIKQSVLIDQVVAVPLGSFSAVKTYESWNKLSFNDSEVAEFDTREEECWLNEQNIFIKKVVSWDGQKKYQLELVSRNVPQ